MAHDHQCFIESDRDINALILAYAPAPDYIVEGLVAYALHRQPTGDFLRCCLENNFMEAVSRADFINQSPIVLKQIANFINMELPSNSWGSAEKVQAWLNAPKAAGAGEGGLERV